MKLIWVTFRKEGIHKYPAALEDPKLQDVSFLGYPHRHIFHFKVWSRHPGRHVKIEVSEDGENGCEIDYPREGDQPSDKSFLKKIDEQVRSIIN